MTDILTRSFSFRLDNSKKVLADYYYNTKLALGVEDDAISAISRYQEKMKNAPEANDIAWTFYHLANCFVKTRDLEKAKQYFYKSAILNTPLSGDAYFALGCIKIKLNENADFELNHSIQFYRNQNHKYLAYPEAIINCQNEDHNIENTFDVMFEKVDGKISFGISEGSYSLAQIDVSFNQIRNFINQELQFANLSTDDNGFFRVKVAFISPLPKRENKYIMSDCYSHIYVCDTSGFNYEEIHEAIINIHGMVVNNMS